MRFPSSAFGCPHPSGCLSDLMVGTDPCSSTRRALVMDLQGGAKWVWSASSAHLFAASKCSSLRMSHSVDQQSCWSITSTPSPQQSFTAPVKPPCPAKSSRNLKVLLVPFACGSLTPLPSAVEPASCTLELSALTWPALRPSPYFRSPLPEPFPWAFGQSLFWWFPKQCWHLCARPFLHCPGQASGVVPFAKA